MNNTYLKEYTENLLKSFTKPQLAPFYLIKASKDDQNFESWFYDFLSQLISKRENLSKERAQQFLNQGHEDLLFIKKEEGQKNYKVDDPLIQEFFKFQQYAPRTWSWRFLILSESNSLSELILNKMLKTLEEPQEKTSIIFLSSSLKKLLATIESRSIVLKKPLGQSATFFQSTSLKDWLKEYRLKKQQAGLDCEYLDQLELFLDQKVPLSEAIDFFGAYEKSEDLLTQIAENYSTSCQFLTYNDFQRTQQLFEQLQLSQVFHQSSSVRTYQILSFLQSTMQSS